METKEAPITITESAAAAILARAEKEGTTGQSLRVRIRGGGCSGVTYDMTWDEAAPGDGDQVTTQHGAVTATSPASEPLMIMLRSGVPNRTQA